MNNYLIEKRLSDTAPDLHQRVRSSFFALQRMLDSYLSWFPDFTDHSLLHSMDVLDYCNRLLGDQVRELTPLECYVLIMSCYLHDAGMGVSAKDFETFSKELDLSGYRKKNPMADMPQTIRSLHHEFSGRFIHRYADLFDIPNETLLFAIVQVSRGHRKTDLFDEAEYPNLGTGESLIRLPFLAAVLRLADEIDVGADRNPELLFDTSKLTKQEDIDAFGLHETIRTVNVTEKSIILFIKPIEPRFVELVDVLAGKIQQTLDYCREVSLKRSNLQITQQKLEIIPLE